tara:strand:- start:849 stop:7742 length:6894 start_codon:yes stop_codon:yes gene_type:complete
MKTSIALIISIIIGGLLFTPSLNDEINNQNFGVIDDSYEVNSIGAYNHIIPIDIAPGVNGFQPQIAIAYNSSGGQSALGIGWSLTGMSKITRTGNNYSQHGQSQGITFTGEDAFLLDGQFLTCVKGKNGRGGSEYRTENETFIKVFADEEMIKNSKSSPKKFVVKHPNGHTYYYGVRDNKYKDNSRLIIDVGTDREEILEWNVNRIEDDNGNYIDFNYHNTRNSIRIQSITYTGNIYNNTSPTNKISFNYNDEASIKKKVNETYIAGNQFIDNSILSSISVETDGNDPFKYYHFKYDSSYSTLTEVFESSDEKNIRHLSPTKIQYYQVDTLRFEKQNVKRIPYLRNEIKNYKQYLVDINQDGTSENLVFNNSGAWLELNIFSEDSLGFKTEIEKINLEKRKYNITAPIDQLSNLTGITDINGDGFPDIYTSDAIWLYDNNPTDTISFVKQSNEFIDGKKIIEITGNNGKIVANDFNGDGRSELALLNQETGEHVLLNFNKENNKIEKIKINQFNQKYTRVELASFRQGETRDIVFLKGTLAKRLFYNNGEYSFTSFTLPQDYKQEFINRLNFIDFNFDGLDDIYLDSDDANLPVSLNKGSISGDPKFTKFKNLKGPNKWSKKMVMGNFVNGGYLEALVPISKDEYEIFSFAVKGGEIIEKKEDAKLINIPKLSDLDFTTSKNYGFIDFNGDGLTDFFINVINSDPLKSEQKRFINKAVFVNKISSVIDGFNNGVKVNYTNIKNSKVYTQSDRKLASDYNYYHHDFIVVKELFYTNGLKKKNRPKDFLQIPNIKKDTNYFSNYFEYDSLNKTNYFYEDLIYQIKGRGMSGFRKFSSIESHNGITKDIVYEYEFPLTGRIKEEHRYSKNGVTFFSQINKWSTKVYLKSVDFIEDLSVQTKNLETNREIGKEALSILKNWVKKDNISLYSIGLNSTEELQNEKLLRGVAQFNKTGLRYLPYLEATAVEKKELDGTLTSQSAIYFTYNSFGNIIKKETVLGDNTHSIELSEYTRFDKPNIPTGFYRLGLLQKKESYVKREGLKTLSRVTNYNYNNKGKLVKQEREKGTDLALTTMLEYDLFGNVVRINKFKDPSTGISEEYTYSEDGRFMIASKNPLGHITKQTYDHRFGSIKTFTDPNKNTTVKSYDEFAQLVSIKYPDDKFEKFQYSYLSKDENFFNTTSNALYKIVHSSPTKESITTYFDKMGREVASVKSLVDTTKFNYKSVRVSSELGDYFRTEPMEGKYTRRLVIDKNIYNNSGNLYAQYKPQYIQVTYKSDESIECIKYEDSLEYVTKFYYDDFNRIIKKVNPDGNFNKVMYNGLEKVEISTGGIKTTTIYNKKSEPIRILNNANQSIKYEYDLWGKITGIINHNNSRIETSYDKLGRKTQLNDPNLGKVKYTYDEFDRQVKETTNNSKIVILEYDNLSRIIKKEMGNRSIEWIYDKSFIGAIDKSTTSLDMEVVSEEKSIYDNLGNLIQLSVSVEDTSYTTKYNYDNYSRLISKVHPNGYKVNYEYINDIVVSLSDSEKELYNIKNLGASGELNLVRYGNGIATEKVFDKSNGLVKGIRTFSKQNYTRSLVIKECPIHLNPNPDRPIIDGSNIIYPTNPIQPPIINPFDPTPSNPLDPNNPYGPFGPYGPENRNTLNGFAIHLSEVTTEELNKIKKNNHSTTKTLTDLQKLSFEYNKDYSILEKKDYVNNTEEHYDYDQLNRLSQYIKKSSLNSSEVKISYNASGNIITKSDVGTYSYYDNAFQRVKSIIKDFEFTHKFIYDSYGNVIEDQAENLKIEYTAFNKPSKIRKQGLIFEIEYGASNQQIIRNKKENDSVYETRIRPFADYEIIENQKGVTYINYILFNGQIIAIQNTVKTKSDTLKFKHFIHKDHLGNIQVVSDENGDRIAEYSYDAFGKKETIFGGSNTIERGFTGHEHLEDFGIIDAGGRYYNPTIGRFLSADPFIQSPNNLQSLNRYSYALNNPINIIDPSGYWNIGRAISRGVRSIGRAVSNVGRAITNGVKNVADVVVKAHEDIYAEGDRFVNKYGKQIVIVAAAAAITYFSAGTLSGFGAAMLQGAAWGAGISGSITAIRGGSFQDVLNAGFNGAIIGAAAGATAFAGAELSETVSFGKQMLGGVNGYTSSNGSEDGLYRGIVASFVPADLNIGATKSNAWALQLGSSAVRGYVIGGEEGMKNQVVGNALTQAVGHGVGLYSSSGEGPSGFKDGVYLYKSGNSGSVSIGGSASIGKDEWSNEALIDHEVRHFTEQNTLGGSYLLIHGPLAGVNAVSNGKYSPLDRPPYHSNPEGGNYTRD